MKASFNIEATHAGVDAVVPLRTFALVVVGWVGTFSVVVVARVLVVAGAVVEEPAPVLAGAEPRSVTTVVALPHPASASATSAAANVAFGRFIARLG
jgi:hypothetical protein